MAFFILRDKLKEWYEKHYDHWPTRLSITDDGMKVFDEDETLVRTLAWSDLAEVKGLHDEEEGMVYRIVLSFKDGSALMIDTDDLAADSNELCAYICQLWRRAQQP